MNPNESDECRKRLHRSISKGPTVMKKFILLLVVVAALAGVVVFTITSRNVTAQEAAPIFVKKIPPGYRDWRVVSVAHEAGDLNDIRAVLGNDIAIKAYREGKLPFPEGAIVGRIAWSYVPSEENNKSFGREQSFVAGSPTDAYLQFMVKDSKKYAATGGWGYSSFDKDGKPTDDGGMKSCFPCHQAIKDRDFIFTRYAP
jgi:cytochrome P460